MHKIKDFFQKCLFKFAGSASYILFKDQLYSKNAISVKNDRVHFVKRWSLLPINLAVENLEGEEFYLLIIHTDNIAHFFMTFSSPFILSGEKIKSESASPLKAIHSKENFWNPSLIQKI